MLVNGANAAKVAAARHGNLGLVVLAEQYADEVVGCADLAHEIVRNLCIGYAVAADLYRRGIEQANGYAQFAQNLKLQRYVDNLGYIFNTARAVNQQSRRHDRDRCVLCAADGHFAVQGLAAVNYIFRQVNRLLNVYSSLDRKRNLPLFPQYMKAV